MNNTQTPARRLGLALAALTVMTGGAGAYTFPGTEPSFGSAVAAKVIGQHCTGMLTASQATEIDAYIAKSSSEMVRHNDRRGDRSYNTPSPDELMKSLTGAYTAKYRDAANCNPGALEEVRDTLAKVRVSMANGGPAFPIETDPGYKPHAGAAISAKVTGEKCTGALTGLELAQLEYFIARSWLHRAQTVADSDSRYEMKLLKAAEKDMSNGWRPDDCTSQAATTAKAVAAAVAKELSGGTP